MKRVYAPPLILFIALAAACSANRHKGEATEAVYKYFDWEIRYTAAIKTLSASRAAGKIDDTTYRAIDIVVQEGRKLLDQMHDSVDAQMRSKQPGEPIVIDVDLNTRFLAVLEKLLYLAARHK